VSAALLVWIFNRVDTAEPSMRIGGGDWGPILLVWLVQSLLPFVQAERWRLIAATLGAKPRFSVAAKNVYVGQFFNQVLPSAIGGDAVRVWKLTRFMPVEAALSSVALDRIVALLAVPVILAIGSGMLARIVPEGPFRWTLYALTGAAICGLALLLSADRIPLPGVLRRSRLVAVVLATPKSARMLFTNPGCLLRTMLLSIIIHAGVGTSLWILARNFVADAPIAPFLLLAPIVTLVTAIPISVGGWGVREGAMVTALGLVNIQPSIALTISIQFGLIMMVVGLPGGVLTFFDPSPRRDPVEDG
jgi:glycosyltransferase 2 family protein